MKHASKQYGLWLKVLLVLQLAEALLTLLTIASAVLPISLSGSYVSWIQRFLGLATLLCLLLMPGCFLPSAIAKAALLLCNLLRIALPGMWSLIGADSVRWILQLIGWITPMLAVASIYLEYLAHGRMVPQQDKAWKMLLAASLSVTLVTNIIVMCLQDYLTQMVKNGVTWGITAYNILAKLLTLAISAWYLVLLYKNLKSLKQEETHDGN